MMKREWVVCGCAILLFAGSINAQVSEEWTRRYAGPGGYLDYGRAIDVDADGYIYVAGSSYGSGTLTDMITLKYAPDGTQEWARSFDGPASSYDHAYGVVVDPFGDICVTGFAEDSSQDFVTIKYNSDGDTLWVRWYDGPDDDYDNARTMAVDASGNVYVAGFSDGGSGYGDDYCTIKYSPDGVQQWVRRYAGPAGDIDWIYDIAVGPSGNVYVTGNSTNVGYNSDIFTIAYSPGGDSLWTARYDGGISNSDVGRAIAVDSSGNVYVTGYSVGTGTDWDYATIKYDASGNEQWVRRYNGPANSSDDPSDIGVDPDGNIIVTGGSYGTGAMSDFLTIKYAPDSTEIWVARYDRGVNNDGPSELAIDASGNIYLAGASSAPFGGVEYTTIKYDTNGDTVWVIHYDGPRSYDIGNAIALDGSGNVYVTGDSDSVAAAWYDIVTIKYSQYLCGDSNGDGSVTTADGYHTLNYFGAGPQPNSCFEANVNGDGALTTSDGYHLLNYFGAGPDLTCAPCDF
jgi:uncharacterized delta-60 repeat protein